MFKLILIIEGNHMKFTRINENAIRCVITKEEMFDYGIEISEIVDNRDKAEDFLRRVMQEARYELDYKTNGGALSVQIAVLPEGDVAMTIAEADPSRIVSQMKMLKDYLEDFQRILEGKVVAQNSQKGVPAKQEEESLSPIQSFISVAEPLWVRCESLDECIKIAELSGDISVRKSSLYSYKDEYYLRVEIKEAETIGRFLLAICEYGKEVFFDYDGTTIINEHGKCIIKKDAIYTLKNI